jgi:hypothetical protein
MNPNASYYGILYQGEEEMGLVDRILLKKLNLRVAKECAAQVYPNIIGNRKKPSMLSEFICRNFSAIADDVIYSLQCHHTCYILSF